MTLDVRTIENPSATPSKVWLEPWVQAAEQTLLDPRLLLVTGKQSKALLSLLDRPARDNAGLKDLFSRRASWAE
jgi:uncharacterized protein (DUF1778 family)